MKLLKFVFLINIFFLLLIFPAHSQELKTILYVSNQPSTFDQSKSVREYIIGETAFCTFFAQGFWKDPEGRVHLTAHVRFIDPNGNILFEENNFAQNQSMILSDQKTIPLENRMDITFEETDPLGMYKLNVQISDRVAKTKAESEITLLLFDTKESKDLIMAPVQDAKHLDTLWAEYFRSKNPWAVKRIISALRLRKESPLFEDALIAEATKWSLEVNARQDPEVLSICKQSLEYAKGAIKELLEEVIRNVENKN